MPYRAFVVSVVLMLASAAFGANITFLDLTDQVTLSTDDTSGRVSNFCPGTTENCVIFLAAPSVGSAPFCTPSCLGGNLVLNIAEPDGLTRSDAIFVNRVSAISIEIQFFSDNEGDPPLLCANFFGGCQLIEDGTIQLAVVINWLDDAGQPNGSDSVFFQSDVSDAVPEPASLGLVLAGIAGIGFLTRMRRRA